MLMKVSYAGALSMIRCPICFDPDSIEGSEALEANTLDSVEQSKYPSSDDTDQHRHLDNSGSSNDHIIRVVRGLAFVRGA